MRCTRCGNELPANLKFCENCGQPVQPAGVPPRPPMQPMPRKKANLPLMIALIVVGVAVVCGAIFFFLQMNQPGGNQGPNATTGIQSPSVAPSAQPTELPTVAPTALPTAIPTTLPLTQVAAFLPAENTYFKYYNNYPDGDAGYEEQWTYGVGGGNIAIIMKTPELGVVSYLFKRDDGVVRLIYDMNPKTWVPWLKRTLTVGSKVESKVYNQTILKDHQPLDLGFTQLTDCIVIQEDFIAAEYSRISWFAPGLGRVLETDLTGKYEYLKLVAFNEVEQSFAATTFEKYEKNFAKIK
ncbi:MAG: zinc-ribbon domain-containing protein [Clostridia bacterium]